MDISAADLTAAGVHATQSYNQIQAGEDNTTKLNDFLSESGYTIADLKWVELLNLLRTDAELLLRRADEHARRACHNRRRGLVAFLRY